MDFINNNEEVSKSKKIANFLKSSWDYYTYEKKRSVDPELQYIPPEEFLNRYEAKNNDASLSDENSLQPQLSRPLPILEQPLFSSKKMGPLTKDETEKNLPVEKKIENAAESLSSRKYIKVGDDAYMCDDYVQEVVEKAGLKWTDYLSGQAKTTTVDQHINNLDKTKFSESTPTETGAYIVLMKDINKHVPEKKFPSHAAILLLKDNNSYFIDNSSSNKGVEKTVLSVNNNLTPKEQAQKLTDKFGYDAFYYAKLK